MVKDKKRIIILGAGFSGGTAARTLAQNLPKNSYEIILIDHNDFTVFTADIYEVATAFNKEITEECLTQLRKTVATPIVDTVNTRKVTFIKGEVTKIDPKKNQIHLKDQKLTYDYLGICLGSVVNFYNIPGLKEHSIPLKTIQNAIAINCHIDQIFLKAWKKKTKPEINIVVGGGGATGVETIGELITSLPKLCKKYKYPKKLVKLHLVEGGEDLGGLTGKYSNIIIRRFKHKGVVLHLNNYITEVTKKTVKLKSGKKTSTIPADFVIWTGGIMANPAIPKSLGTPESRGAVKVNEHLQSIKAPNIFAAGDSCYFLDARNGCMPLPMLATLAQQQGKILAENIIKSAKESNLETYKPKFTAMLIPIGGKCAIYKNGKLTFAGRLAWYIRRLITLKYCLSILPPLKAFKKWQHGNRIFVTND